MVQLSSHNVTHLLLSIFYVYFLSPTLSHITSLERIPYFHLYLARKNKLHVYKTAAKLQSVPLGIRLFYGMKVLD